MMPYALLQLTFLSNLYPQREARAYNSKIKSCTLYWLSQLSTPSVNIFIRVQQITFLPTCYNYKKLHWGNRLPLFLFQGYIKNMRCA